MFLRSAYIYHSLKLKSFQHVPNHTSDITAALAAATYKNTDHLLNLLKAAALSPIRGLPSFRYLKAFPDSLEYSVLIVTNFRLDRLADE